MLRFTIAGLTLLATTISAPARAPLTLTPSSPWNVHYADNSCKLLRIFGEGKQRTTMVLERLSPDGEMNLLVFGGGLRSRTDGRSAKATFLPLEHVLEDGMIAATTDTNQTAIQWTGIAFAPEPEDRDPPKSPSEVKPRDLAEIAARRTRETANAAKVTGLVISEPGGRRLQLQTGAMGRVHALMRECAREQLLNWGLDPAVDDRIVLPARSDKMLWTYLTSRDYPQAALMRGEEAIISARLIVGADRRVTRCTSLTDFKAPEMAEVVCRNLSKATFQPAELANGTKVPDYVITRIRFRMGG